MKLSLDSSNGSHGGRPAMEFFDPSLPVIGSAGNKTRDDITGIFGITGGSNPIPLHFQVKTSAKLRDHMRIKNEVLEHMPKTLVPYGREEPEYLPPTFGCNEKGGMNNEEFVEYAMNVWHIFDNVVDIFRICYKVDSGPGRGQIVLKAALRAQGVCIFPGVPNTTAVMQEMDQRYGPFKTGFNQSLKKL
jgi:hypothetical protein